MTPEEFRAAAHELVDWITDRRIEIESRPVRPDVEPGDVAARLPAAPPTGGESAAQLLRHVPEHLDPADPADRDAVTSSVSST